MDLSPKLTNSVAPEPEGSSPYSQEPATGRMGDWLGAAGGEIGEGGNKQFDMTYTFIGSDLVEELNAENCDRWHLGSLRHVTSKLAFLSAQLRC
jgi:hypothetical protein